MAKFTDRQPEVFSSLSCLGRFKMQTAFNNTHTKKSKHVGNDIQNDLQSVVLFIQHPMRLH